MVSGFLRLKREAARVDALAPQARVRWQAARARARAACVIARVDALAAQARAIEAQVHAWASLLSVEVIGRITTNTKAIKLMSDNIAVQAWVISAHIEAGDFQVEAMAKRAEVKAVHAEAKAALAEEMLTAAELRLPYLMRRHQRPPPPVPVPIITGFVLAAMWSPSYDYSIPPRKLYLHGGFENTMSINPMPNPIYFKDRIKYPRDLLSMLEQGWPSITKGGLATDAENLAFWEHEWAKHGVHFGVPYKKFFETVLYVFDMLPPLVRYRKDLGIKIGSRTVKELRSSIKRRFGVEAEIHAIMKKKKKNKKKKKAILHFRETRFEINKYLGFEDRLAPLYSGKIQSETDMVYIPK